MKDALKIALVVVLGILGVSFAFSQNPSEAATVTKSTSARHIDFTTVLTGLDGKPLQEPASPIDKTLHNVTLGSAAINALETTLDEDRSTTGEDKFKRDELARRINNKSDVVLSVEDIALIKHRIGAAYPSILVGAAWRILDPSTGN